MAFNALPNIFALTPLDPKSHENPHAVLDDLRTRCPVY